MTAFELPIVPKAKNAVKNFGLSPQIVAERIRDDKQGVIDEIEKEEQEDFRALVSQIHGSGSSGVAEISKEDRNKAEALLDVQEGKYIQLKTDICGYQTALEGKRGGTERTEIMRHLEEATKRATQIEIFLIAARKALAEK